jgi:hypothetical protein
VNWRKALPPKSFGGLGILDLDMFSRALHLRWLWYSWTEPDGPWVGMQPPVDAVDKQLFRVSTIVTVDDGAKASFWQSSWMDGRAPMDLFPDLFRLAWRKNKTVREELENHNWTRGLWRMQSVELRVSFSRGILCKMCNFQICRTASLGGGRQMEPTQQSQHVMRNSVDYTVPSEGIIFGKLRQRESTSSLLGYWFKARY